MYHLSKEMTGLVLPAETFGIHLQNGKTVDDEMKEKNFEGAGKVLADIQNNMEIYEHKVVVPHDQ